ncbi:MAG: allB [Acidobacteria bacterium]|nr:allB [Acidobacteriota bacterium]
MPAADLVIRGPRVALSESANLSSSSYPLPESIRPASIHIANGLIVAIGDYDEVPIGCAVEAASASEIIIPGLVDTHVHINEPGRTDWEGFASATRAAAAGGVTTLIDMPLNSIPPTTTVAGLEAKLAAAAGQCFVDVGFWGGVVPGNTHELAGLSAAGVVGFKCFLIHSGVDEFPNVTESELRLAMPELTRLGALLIVHAELPGPISKAGALACHTALIETGMVRQEDARAAVYQTFLDSRPRAAENEAVELMIKLAGEFGTRIHIVHHSSADALPLLREAKASGLKLTAETCPHYLYFAAEDIPDGATEFKCCPPIRERENREKLWDALESGIIDLVVSDHSPCTEKLKLKESGNFLEAWGGIASLQLRLPVMWTAAKARGFKLENLIEWLCRAPARQVGLQGRKGQIAVGCDADLVFWNPDEQFRVAPELLHHRNKLTPYRGELLQGTVEKTFLRGRKIYDGGEISRSPEGRLLLTGFHSHPVSTG